MFTRTKRLTTALMLTCVPLALLALPGFASAEQPERTKLRKGVYDGIWHTDPVKVIIEKVENNGSFTGEIHFDPNGRWGDVRAGITGELDQNGAITISRDDCPAPTTQIAKAPRPELKGRALVWKGEVTLSYGDAPSEQYSFELRMPSR